MTIIGVRDAGGNTAVLGLRTYDAVLAVSICRHPPKILQRERVEMAWRPRKP